MTLRSFLPAAALLLGWSVSAHGQNCKADPSWFPPNAPAPGFTLADTNCAFHQWAVQEMLYLVQPQDNGLVRFLNLASPHSLFLYSGDKPAPYPGATTSQFQLRSGMAKLKPAGAKGKLAAVPNAVVFLPRTLKTANTTFDASTQAGSNAVLVDQKGQWVYYTSQVNQAYYDFIVSSGYYQKAAVQAAPAAATFPVGAVETKTSWRIAVKDGQTYIPDWKTGYYTIDAQVCKDDKCTSLVPAKMSLVGFHVVGRVEGHPEMVWATFEHQSNAPNCQDTPSARTGYSFYTAGQKCGSSPFWESCNQIPTDNTKPSQVCLAHPLGEPGDKPENIPNIQSLDASFQQLLPAGSIWKNYHYTGAIWTTGMTDASGLLLLDTPNLRGSKKIANSSLESFTQEKNCLHCHTYQPPQIIPSDPDKCFGKLDDQSKWKNLYVSHLVGLLCTTGH